MSKNRGHLFRLGYFLYANTRLGPWMFSRSLRSAKNDYPNGHSFTEVLRYVSNNPNEPTLRILPVPFASDNYAYVIWKEGEQNCALVDPADAEQVLKFLKTLSLTPVSTLITHKHWDHAGGLTALLRDYPRLHIVAPAEVEIPRLNHRVSCISDGGNDQVTIVEDGQNFFVDLNPCLDVKSTGAAYKKSKSVNACNSASTQCSSSLHFSSLHTPGHTTGHMCYVLQGYANKPLLFSGDCLFLGGMGRFFEGTPEINLYSLQKLLQLLPKETVLFPGHEYALANLTFAQLLQSRAQQTVDSEEESNPGIVAVKAKRAWSSQRRQLDPPQMCIPSSLSEELTYNPFLRIAAIQTEDEAVCLLNDWNYFLRVDLNSLVNTSTFKKLLKKDQGSPGENGDQVNVNRVTALKVAFLKQVRNAKDNL